MKCPTTSGPYQCSLDLKPDGSPHDGECITRDGESRPSVRPRAVVVPSITGHRCPTCDRPIEEKTP